MTKNVIDEALSRNDMTQADLARELGISPVTVWRWCRHRYPPLVPLAMRMRDLLGITLDEIYNDYYRRDDDEYPTVQ